MNRPLLNLVRRFVNGVVLSPWKRPNLPHMEACPGNSRCCIVQPLGAMKADTAPVRVRDFFSCLSFCPPPNNAQIKSAPRRVCRRLPFSFFPSVVWLFLPSVSDHNEAITFIPTTAFQLVIHARGRHERSLPASHSLWFLWKFGYKFKLSSGIIDSVGFLVE